jgi:hypothetical protein
MKDILGMVSLTTAASLLLIVAAIWLIILIVKRQHEYIFRAMLVILLILFGLIFLRQHEAGKLTWPALKVKLFPGKPPVYNYTVEKSHLGNKLETRYAFQDPKPKLSLKLDSSGNSFHITDLKSINDTLEHLSLPKVETPVPELGSLTGAKGDVNLYRWDDYPLGVLTVERGLCQDINTLDVYHGIVTIRVLR